MLIELAFIMMIESSGNPQAFNKHSGATGAYQITQICLDDYNARHKEKFVLQEMFDLKKCEKVASWYLLVRIPQMLDSGGYQITPENIMICYNWGYGNFRKWKEGKKDLPTETRDYLKKYELLEKERTP